MSKFGCQIIGEDTNVTIGKSFSSFSFVLGCGQPSRQPSSHSLDTGFAGLLCASCASAALAVCGTRDAEAILTWLAGCVRNKVGLVLKSGCIVSFISMHEV